MNLLRIPLSLLLFLVCLPSLAVETQPAYKSGDIILTRNLKEEDNTTPGYWNHSAISCGSYIIEAQVEPDAVIAVDIEKFKVRYPEYAILRFKNQNIAYKAAINAYGLVGYKYRGKASIFIFLRNPAKGENCVSLVRRAWHYAVGIDPGWRKPDNIWVDYKQGAFELIEYHKDYEHWVKPDDWFGRIDNK